jgi:hypothetical protein
MTPEKWEFIQDLNIFLSLDFIVLTKHQLSAQFQPDEIYLKWMGFPRRLWCGHKPTTKGISWTATQRQVGTSNS